MLAHSEKAADPKDDVFNLAGLVENKFLDITDFFVSFVINVDANEFGRAPLGPPYASSRCRRSCQLRPL
jgi:hypothetical protein